MFKFKYLIPFIGFYYFVKNDIPMTEDQRPFKSLQGDGSFDIIFLSGIVSVVLPTVLLAIYLC